MENNLLEEVYRDIHTPVYVLEEDKLRRNLALIKDVANRADVEIILAFKAYALWKTFPIFREYISGTTASSLSEARLAMEEFGSPAHTYSPAYTDGEVADIARCSSHLTFNSLTQYERYHALVKEVNPRLTLGLRVNPEYSEVGTALYNPCAPGTRFGVSASKLPQTLPSDVEGFHCHCHCESGADVFERTLAHIEERFAAWFPQLKWINFGGGHLMTRADYVVDVVEDHGIRTAILDVSFTCHMPDCLEMPYMPEVRGAKVVDADSPGEHVYRLGGNSCLSGDFMASWRFDHELRVGERVIFEDMLHYTTVKTNTFNGISHPAIALLGSDGKLRMLRQFGYEDYRDRMD